MQSRSVRVYRMSVKSRRSRRATILLMVVSLLALLFVIITGFLSLARVDREMVIDLHRAELADAIAEDTNAWALALIKDQLKNGSGRVLGGGSAQDYSSEDIPGYRNSNWLAALEPVWNPGANVPTAFNHPSWAVLAQLRWPAVTSLDGSLTTPQAFPLFRLMCDYNYDQPFQISDVEWNERRPFMDADADGVPDSHFLLCGPAIEAANTMAGTPVQLPRFNPDPMLLGHFKIFNIPGSGQMGLNYEKWQRYDQQARYEVAVRVVSHGGMVTLDSLPLYDMGGDTYTPFNRRFAVDLFNAIRNRSDAAMWSQYDVAITDPHADSEEDRLFSALHASAAAVEASLRRRFILPGPAEMDRGSEIRKVPPILAELQGEDGTGFPNTLLAQFRFPPPLGGEPKTWQRINLAVAPTDNDQRRGWAWAVAYDPTEYNRSGGGMQVPHTPYDRRHIITTANYSDELARKQTGADPTPTTLTPLDLDDTGNRGATYQGELKFYLGEVAKAFDLNTPGPGQYQYNPARGGVIVQRLARLYFDMLASHDDWASLFAEEGPESDHKQAVSRRQQAFMLAVNTVAFAAPRDLDNPPSATPGFVDAVTYTDDVTYIGYALQPFFTEAIAYNKERAQQTDPNEIAIAVEIYNPGDPFDATGTGKDVFGLYLPQFAVTVDEVDGAGMAPQPLTGVGPVDTDYLDGRSFTSFVLTPAISNVYFEGRVYGEIPIQDGDGNLLSLKTDEPQITIKLWRQRRSDGAWFVIDQIQVAMPTEPPDQNAKWTSVYRDTTAAQDTTGIQLFGIGDPVAGTVLPFTRWNVVTNFTAGASDVGGPLLDTLNNYKGLRTAPLFDPDDPASGSSPLAPTTPLITMNAAPFNDLPVFGNFADLRPRSFPTVGFMLFVPRFSHVYNPAAAGEDHEYVPMSHVLVEQWSRQAYPSVLPGSYPADFGHMPIFDNTQNVTSGSYLDDSTGVGRLPWGLLVFDYFTTLNPLQDSNGDRQPDVDPLRVPGRININTAPWFVLANLPMLGPNTTHGELAVRMAPGTTPTLADPSPSFWDPFVGVLVGQGGWDGIAYTIHRQIAADPAYDAHAGYDMPWARTDADRNMGRYRLGPWLAQSAAAYRDGVQYVQHTGSTAPVNGFEVYADAHLRNGVGDYKSTTGTLQTMPYRLGGYGAVRGALITNPTPAADRPNQFGFIAVGELLNVKGFDSSLHTALPPISALPTTLARGDFIKAVSLVALLDSQYLTTRSNTFTVYTSVMDRKNPQASVRSQTTVDRSNLLPRMTYAFYDPTPPPTYYPLTNLNNPAIASLAVVPLLLDAVNASVSPPVPGQDGIPETPVRMTNENAQPLILAQERVGYFNTRYDD